MSGDKYLISDKAGCYFVTFTVIYWIDIFSRKEYRDIVVDALNYCIAQKGLVVYVWVIMSNHVHMVITTKSDDGNISDIIRDFKKYTSKEITKAMQSIPESRREWLLRAMNKEAKRTGRATYYKLWKDDNHAVTIDGKIVAIKNRINYVHDNPVRNGLVEEQWHYVYRSAKDYQGTKGLVNIEFAF
jgi:REP element-mobilizing transposase RayT